VKASALRLVVLAASMVACGGPAVVSDAGTESDAFVATDAEADAAVPHHIVWSAGPELPLALAFATAQIVELDGQDYVYVLGGSSASRASLGTFSSAVLRSAIDASDGSLGAWEPMGDITIGSAPRPLVGHGSLPISDAMGHQGIALAGGGTSSSALPIVLAVYVDADGTLFDWSRFPPMLTEGQSFGTFDAFEAYRLALVGGLTGSSFSDQVRVAAIDNASTATEWAEGPHLPAPRAHHASFKFANRIYLFGGENLDGPIADVIRTTRDPDGAIDGWETVGTIDTPPLSHAVLSFERSAWLLGGIEGGSFDGAATARVRRASLDADGHVDAFEDVDPLPMPLASSAFASDGATVYLIGGQSGPDLDPVPAVLVGRLD
jgi:hypothetical protein